MRSVSVSVSVSVFFFFCEKAVTCTWNGVGRGGMGCDGMGSGVVWPGVARSLLWSSAFARPLRGDGALSFRWRDRINRRERLCACVRACL